MSEDNPTPSPSEGSIPPVEPIVDDDIAENDTATTAEPVVVAAPVAAAAPTATHPQSHVLMPKWVVFGVVGVALAALGFGIGWIAKPDSGSSRPAVSGRPFANGNPFGNDGPFSGNNGGNGGGSNGSNGSRTSGAFLGVSAKVTTGNDGGAEVAQVVSGSPADDAGLASGDVITKVDSTSISSPQELVQAISGHESGDKVTVTYTRAGDTKTAEVTLGDRSDTPTQQTPSSRSGSED